MTYFLTDREVIARLRKIRLRRGLTARAVAEQIGMKRTAFAALDIGNRKSITWDEIRLISAALDVDPREVVHRDGPELCVTCHDAPAAGFTCNECGASAPTLVSGTR